MAALYNITVKDNRGNEVNLGAYKGKVLLVVNVASYCGLTKRNYTELSEIYTRYRDEGLEILAFPCNQFSEEEPGTNEEIRDFVCTKFGAEFPIFDKIDVNGEDASPLYKLLKTSKGGDNIEWNFAKFLVDRDGEVVERYASTTPPSDFEKDIKEILAK